VGVVARPAPAMGLAGRMTPAGAASLAPGFDRLAPYYRWMEQVLAGRKMQRCRAFFLPEFDGASRILLLGEGRGRCLEALRRRNRSAEITVLDASRRMLELARRDLLLATGSDEGVRFVCASALDWNGDGIFDGVASHFFLDCFPPVDVERIIRRVGSWTRPGARWLLSDFCLPESGWRRWRARAVHAAMYAVFRRIAEVSATAVTPPDRYMEAAGFALGARIHANYGLLHSDVWIRR